MSSFCDALTTEATCTSKEDSSTDLLQDAKAAPRTRKRRYTGSLEDLNSDEIVEIRSKINSRERKRMHDLNVALDNLRDVMPHIKGPSVRKLSKIATLTLARNYIQSLNKSLEEMKQLVDDIYRSGPYSFVNRGGCSQFVSGCAPHLKNVSIPNIMPSKVPNEVQSILVRHSSDVTTPGQCRVGCPPVSCLCVRPSRVENLTGFYPRLNAPVGSLYLPQYRHTDTHFSARSIGNSEHSAFHTA